MSPRQFTALEFAAVLPGFTAAEEERGIRGEGGLAFEAVEAAAMHRSDSFHGDADGPAELPLEALAAFPSLQRATAFDRALHRRVYARAKVPGLPAMPLGIFLAALYDALFLPLLASSFALNDGTYTAAQLAIGYAATAGAWMFTMIFWSGTVLYHPAAPAVYANALTGVAAWKELADEGTSPLFGARLWTSPWAALATCALVVWFGPGFSITMMINPTHAPLMELSNRVQERAVAVALGRSLARFSSRLEDPAFRVPPEDREADVVFHAVLHSRLVRRWRRASADLQSSRVYAAMMVVSFVSGAVVSAAGGSCIPLWILFSILAVMAWIFLDLVTIATSNEGPERIARRYVEAGLRAREMASRAGCREMGQLAEELKDFHWIAQSYAEVARTTRAGLVGYPITWGVLRSFAVTFLTLVLGMFTLLRSAGVAFVPGQFCRSPSS
ncbi:hypothetical protein DFJ74DRAFT_773059 [Hyaloraphidium curvatum]|nr:hypothetical protein DFJ74DRAFT_773059 [Hyaloraphidium curvatum]